MDKLKKKTPLVRFPEFKDEWINEQLGKHIKKTDKKNKENLNLPVYSINNKEGFLPQSEQFDGVNSNDRGFDISIYKIIQPNTFAYNPARINVGSIGYSHNLANILISSLYVCFQTDDKIDDSFLLAFLDTNYFKTSVLRFQEGGVRQYLFFDNISKIKIPFPQLAEQKKIAHFFSIVDKKLNQLEEKKKALELYKKGMMQQIFSQKLRFNDENGNDFPEWEMKKLVDVAKINMGQSPDSSSYNTKEIGKYLIQGNADIFDRKTKPRNWTSEPTKTCEIDDIIMTVRAPVGAIARSIHNACIGRGVCSIKNNLDNNLDFIYQVLLNYENKWDSLAQGSTFTAVSGKDIRNLKLSFTTLKEQTKIANFLSKIDAKINAVNEQIENTKKYKKGLLQKMFV